MAGQSIIAFGILSSLALGYRVEYYFQSHFLAIAVLLLGIGIALIGLIVRQIDSEEQPIVTVVPIADVVPAAAAEVPVS